MLHKVERPAYERVRPLVGDNPLALAVSATLDGTCPGAVWVDDPADPAAAVVETPEGEYAVGDPATPGFGQSLRALIADILAPGGRGEKWWWYYLRCPTPEWAEAVRRVLPVDRMVEEPREFYVCRQLALDWRERIRPGFELHQVDEQFLARQDVRKVGQFRDHARDNFVSVEQFLDRGFAFCLVHHGEIVGHCSADNASGRMCEVGVHTAQDYRRQGLATVVVAAAVEWALMHGFKQVGWHCLRHNLASAATARKVGFEKAADYVAFKVCVKAADASAQKGNLCLMDGDYLAAAGWYERALQALAEDGPGASHLLERPEAVNHYLLQAAVARALADQPIAAGALLDRAIEAAGYRQGGY